jgi:hypothetical protein
MRYRLGIMAALVGWAPPLHAQVGITSAGSTLALSASKAASVSIALRDAGAGGREGPTRVPIATLWELDPRRTGAVVLVASMPRAARAEARAASGGAKRFARFESMDAKVVFVQRVSPLSPTGRRLDELPLGSDPVGALDLRVITQ